MAVLSMLLGVWHIISLQGPLRILFKYVLFLCLRELWKHKQIQTSSLNMYFYFHFLPFTDPAQVLNVMCTFMCLRCTFFCKYSFKIFIFICIFHLPKWYHVNYSILALIFFFLQTLKFSSNLSEKLAAQSL